MPSYLILLAALALVIAAVADLGWRLIPNWVPAALVLLFALAMLSQGEVEELGHSLLVGLGVLAAGAALFAAGLFGGGDAKLFAAATVWTGLSGLPTLLLGTALTGGLLALLVLFWRAVLVWLGRRPGADRGVPYGVAIAVAALWVLATRFW